MPKSKRHSSRKTPTKKDAEKSVVPHCSGGMGWFSGSVSPVHKPSPLKDIKIDPNPPDSYPKFCAWFVQILGYVQPIVESGQSYDDDGEFEYAADVQPHVEQIKAALTNAAYRIKHFPALMAKCDTMYRPGGLSAFVRKLRHDIDRGSFDRLLLERISDAIEGEAGDSALPAEQASVEEPAADQQGSGGPKRPSLTAPSGPEDEKAVQLSAQDWGERYSLSENETEALEARLRRKRGKESEGNWFREVQLPKRHDSAFVYRGGTVLPMIDDIKERRVGGT